MAHGVGPLPAGKAQLAHAPVDGAGELLKGHGGGIADVKADGDAVLVGGEDRGRQGQPAGGVGEVHAQPFAVVVAAEQPNEAGEGLPIRHGQVGFREGQQKLCQGVVRMVRHGGVPLLALEGQNDRTILAGDRGRRFPRDHVGRGAHLGPNGAGVFLFKGDM